MSPKPPSKSCVDELATVRLRNVTSAYDVTKPIEPAVQTVSSIVKLA